MSDFDASGFDTSVFDASLGTVKDPFEVSFEAHGPPANDGASGLTLR
jgi:hypothetical protein